MVRRAAVGEAGLGGCEVDALAAALRLGWSAEPCGEGRAEEDDEGSTESK